MNRYGTIAASLTAAGLACAVWFAGCGQAGGTRVFSTVPPARGAEPAASNMDLVTARPVMRGKPVATRRPAETVGYPDPAAMEARMRPETTQVTQARSLAPAVNVYGEMPASGMPAGAPGEAALLDGMESLSQVTFAGEGGAFDPCLSKDGKMLVFASTQHRQTADIYIKAVSGRTVTQLTADPAQDIMPAISPDGQRIAFASNRAGSWDIYLISINGGQAAQLTGDRSHELHPSWSPDGSKIVYCRLGEVSGRWEMWVTDVNQPVVSEFIGYGLFPRWCPVTGTGEGGRDRILFQRSRERGDRAFSVWTVDYKAGDAGSPTEIATTTGGALINPAWSPDGQRIVFAVVPNPGDMSGSENRPVMADLWMSDVNGAGRVNLTAGRFVNLMPAWGPDGRIYFVSDRAGIENIWSIGTEKAILAASGVGGAAGAKAVENAHVPTGD